MAQSQETIIRESAVQTLGYVCEELEYSQIPQDKHSTIISSIATNMLFDGSFDDDTLEIVLTAFYNAVPFTVNNFLVSHERDYIMNQLFLSFKHKNDDVRMIGYQAMAEIAKRNYDQIDTWLVKIYENTQTAVENEEDKIAA